MNNFLPPEIRKRAKTPQKGAMPPLTSLVDMMTILLVFLLQSYSSEGQLVTPSQDLALPRSTSDKKPAPALMIEVTRTGVLVDGKSVLTMEAVRKTEGLDIPVLHEWLVGIAELSGKSLERREVIIQCDKNIDFKELKKIMGTCARASYNDFSLLVMQKD